jgi:hypothetical protein
MTADTMSNTSTDHIAARLNQLVGVASLFLCLVVIMAALTIVCYDRLAHRPVHHQGVSKPLPHTSHPYTRTSPLRHQRKHRRQGSGRNKKLVYDRNVDETWNYYCALDMHRRYQQHVVAAYRGAANMYPVDSSSTSSSSSSEQLYRQRQRRRHRSRYRPRYYRRTPTGNVYLSPTVLREFNSQTAISQQYSPYHNYQQGPSVWLQQQPYTPRQPPDTPRRAGPRTKRRRTRNKDGIKSVAVETAACRPDLMKQCVLDIETQLSGDVSVDVAAHTDCHHNITASQSVSVHQSHSDPDLVFNHSQ